MNDPRPVALAPLLTVDNYQGDAMPTERAAPSRLSWLAQPTAVDTVVAILLDSADRDEAVARANGRTRTAQAGVRYTRRLAHELAPHGSGKAFEDPNADPNADGPTHVTTDGGA